MIKLSILIVNLFIINLLFVLLLLNNSIMYYKLEIAFNEKIKHELMYIINTTKYNMTIKESRNLTSDIKYVKTRKIKIIHKRSVTYNNDFKKDKSKILIAIHSHISLFYHRFVFRKIYKLYSDIQVLFFIALDTNQTEKNILYNEMKKYKDIILFNFYSNYNSLYLLTYYFLKWVYKYRLLYEVIIKQDTDTFLNIINLKLILAKIPNNVTFVLGHIWFYSNKFIRYPSGMAYVFLSKSINRIILPLDDIINRIKDGYPEDKLFGLLARKAGLIIIDSYISYKYNSYIKLPNIFINITNMYMIHWLRISEIAYLHLQCNNLIQKYVNITLKPD